MSALSTPGGGGTTAQSKPTSGKPRFQKLDINSLYCVNKNENSEPSSAKSQLSRKHGMQSLGKVPSARRPPANLPSLKTETGQDPNANSISASTATTSAPASCSPQTTTTTLSSSVIAGTGSSGWVPLPPPVSPHFRTEFPSLEASAQPSHRTADHSASQPQLRPQTEGSWTCGGNAGGRAESSSPGAAPASSPASQQTPAFRAILPSFWMKGSSGVGLGLGNLSGLRERGGERGAERAHDRARHHPRPAAAARAVEANTPRPILRDDQISSLDDISRDAGWAQHDDIDYDQKLDFSDGESTSASSSKGSKNRENNNRDIENERTEPKRENDDSEQVWAERRQTHRDEVAMAVARARQLKEEGQRRQMRDSVPPKDSRDRNDNREREHLDSRDKDRGEVRERERLDRMDSRDKERNDIRDRDKDRLDNRDRDRMDNRDRDRFDNRDRGIDSRDRARPDNRDRDRDRMDNRDRDRHDNRDNRSRGDNRERPENIDKDRTERDRDRNDRDRIDRDRFDRERDRDKIDRERDREREFRDRDYNRDRDSKGGYQVPPRFLKQQQSRQPPPRRQEPLAYNPPPRHGAHNGRRSVPRDHSDREDDYRRDKEGSGPQWRSEMQGRDMDRQNSKEYNDYKDRRHDSDRKSDSIDHSSRTSAADKLTEVFERKSIGLAEPFGSSESTQTSERRHTPPSISSQRESSERDFSQTSWADASHEEQSNYTQKQNQDKVTHIKQESIDIQINKESIKTENDDSKRSFQQTPHQPASNTSASFGSEHKFQSHQTVNQNFSQNQISSISNLPLQSQPASNLAQNSFNDHQILSKSGNAPLTKQGQIESNIIQVQKQASTEHLAHQNKHLFTSQKSDMSESESVASKSSTDPILLTKIDKQASESLSSGIDSQKRSSLSADDKRVERFSNDQHNKLQGKEPIERKSSGSGSEKKGRGYGGGYPVYRQWGQRRSHRSSRSNNRASESDGSTDGAPNPERKERRRAPRSPRGNKKDDGNRNLPHEQIPANDTLENREPFAPRGQPSRRGRGGFQGTTRPPPPAKRVSGYGPPNTKSPFSQANRVKENEDLKDGNLPDEKAKPKQRTGSSTGRVEGGRGRDRRPKGGAVPSGEDENWETTSEHSEGGGTGRRRSVGGRSQKGGRNVNNGVRQPNRNGQGSKKEISDNRSTEVTEAMTDLKISIKKEEEIPDDGFQEVRNKKTSKDTRGPVGKEDNKQPRSHSNQGAGRNGSSSRNPNDKSNNRGSAPVAGKPSSQYDRPRQTNLPPRFAKQRQKQQMGIVSGFGSDIGAAPPPPPINAWDKPISQSLRGNVEEPTETVDKSTPSSQRSTPAETPAEIKTSASCSASVDKTGVLDGSTPPVETIIFENTNYKSAPPAEALKQKYQPTSNVVKNQSEDLPTEMDARSITFNGDVRTAPPRTIQELISENSRPVVDGENSLGLQMSFESAQKAEDSSDMKLDFAFDSDLGQLTEDKTAKSLGLPRGTHMSTSNTISPLAADLNLKIASVKKVWEMPAVVEGSEELQFAAFEEAVTESGAPPNVCKVKPTQQLQSPPPQHYNHMGYQGGYGGLSVPSPPAVLFNSTQQLLGSSQQLQQQGGLYGAFLDQSRGQFGGFPGSHYGAGSAAPYNYQPPPDIFQSLPSQYRMAAAGGAAAFGQSGQMGNNPSTVLISSTSNSLMSATVKPSSQQIGAIGSKGGGVGGVGSVSSYQQQYLGYSGPVGDPPYSLQGLLPRPAPPANSYYSPYQPPAAPAPSYPLQFTQQAQSGAFGSQFLSSQLQVAAAVQQMQQQYRQPMQQQYAPQPRPPPQQMKSPLHEHANGFTPLCESASPTPKGVKPAKPPHSPPQHKYQQHHAHPHHAHHQHQQHQQQMVGMGNNGRGGGGGANNGMSRGNMSAPRYPSPIQRPHAPAPPAYRGAPPRTRYYQQPRAEYAAPPGRAEDAGGSPPPAGDAPLPDAPPDAKPE